MPQTPTFVWSPVDGAANYRVEISKFPTYAPVYDSITTYNTQYTPTKKYDLNVEYYWRVAIVDADNKQGPFTGATIVIENERLFLPYAHK